MSWHYLQGLEADFSEVDFSGGKQFVPLRSMSIGKKSSCKEKHSLTGRDLLRTWSEETNNTGCEDCGESHDVSSRMDAVKALGDAQIPRVATRAYKILNAVLENAEKITKKIPVINQNF